MAIRGLHMIPRMLEIVLAMTEEMSFPSDFIGNQQQTCIAAGSRSYSRDVDVLQEYHPSSIMLLLLLCQGEICFLPFL
jgi:hypothetical protein